MKSIGLALIGLLGLLQYELWLSQGGIVSILQVKRHLQEQEVLNHQMQLQNDQLLADIKDLKHGNEAVEERAREELGLIKPGETFYQIIGSNE
ncbi:MAG TPA: cell division protein FtsB [Coxiellaceae bacterium]|nr:cell division protein FtsB [Coxiellaceae bacterium]